jgi:hypothetical protein
MHVGRPVHVCWQVWTVGCSCVAWLYVAGSCCTAMLLWCEWHDMYRLVQKCAERFRWVTVGGVEASIVTYCYVCHVILCYVVTHLLLSGLDRCVLSCYNSVWSLSHNSCWQQAVGASNDVTAAAVGSKQPHYAHGVRAMRQEGCMIVRTFAVGCRVLRTHVLLAYFLL